MDLPMMFYVALAAVLGAGTVFAVWTGVLLWRNPLPPPYGAEGEDRA